MMADRTCRAGSYVSVEADGIHYGRVLKLEPGRALVKWNGVEKPSWIDDLNLLQRDGSPWDAIGVTRDDR
jgi:hypothetical protein